MSKYNHFQVSGVTHNSKMDSISIFLVFDPLIRLLPFKFVIIQNTGTIKIVTTLSWTYILLIFSDTPTCL